MEVDSTGADREAVLDAARSFFTASEADESQMSGVLLEWVRLRRGTPWRGHFKHRRAFEGAEILELGATRAVLQVRGEHNATIARGSYRFRASLDGPAVLEKIDGQWRIVDFTIAGRRRLQSLVLGPLAEQEHQDVVVRVVGVDRSAYATEVLLEIVNSRVAEIRVERGLMLLGGSWTPVSTGSKPQIVPAGATTTVSLIAGTPLELSQQGLSVAVRVRAGRRKVPFLLQVPLVRPEVPFRQSPPRRLPLLRSSWLGTLALYAVGTGALAWYAGWLALGPPLYLLLAYWRHWRLFGLLPERLHRARFVLDAVVLGGAFLLLWETPAAELAVPFVVAILAYAALRPFAPNENARQLVALSAAATWLVLLGTSTGPLSACRLANGPTGATADTFAGAILTGDFTRAHRYEATSSLRRLEAYLRPPVSERAAIAAIATRRVLSHNQGVCRYLRSAGSVDCYLYALGQKGQARRVLWVGIGCQARHWRVDAWLGY
jgi:hypothetical protein